MWVVPLYDKVLSLPSVDAANSFLTIDDLEGGEIPWLALQLGLEGINMVEVNVGVAHDVSQTSRYEVAYVGQHVG